MMGEVLVGCRRAWEVGACRGVGETEVWAAPYPGTSWQGVVKPSRRRVIQLRGQASALPWPLARAHAQTQKAHRRGAVARAWQLLWRVGKRRGKESDELA